MSWTRARDKPSADPGDLASPPRQAAGGMSTQGGAQALWVGAGAAGGNGGDGLGGAIFNGGASPFGTPSLTVNACQILQNQASAGAAGLGGSDGVGLGGGIFNVGTLAIDAITVVNQNHASTNGDNIFP